MMPKSYPAMYLLEFLLRRAREVAESLPDDTMQREGFARIRDGIEEAHHTTHVWLHTVERRQS